MPLYQYQATDQKGKPVQGMVAAASRSQAHQKLRQRGLFPLHLDEDLAGGTRQAGGEDLAHTSLQLAALLKSGIPTDEALESLTQTAESARLRRALARVRVCLREGQALSEAMAEDDTFPPMLVRMVAAGEESGQPAIILGRYANFLQEEIEHRRALQSALTYPVVLVFMSVIILVALLVLLTPVIQEMYASMDRDLPTMTRVMVDLGAVLRSWGLPALLGLGVVGFLVWRSLPRIALDRWKLDLPLLGSLVRAGLISRWARTLGLLYGAGVPLVRALQMSREVIDNQYLNRELRGVEKAVERGDGLAVAMGRVWLVPPLLTQFLRTGERTGDLEPMLVSAAGFYERELTRRRTAMVRWLEPGLILFMGVVVGLLVVSALLPLSQLAAEL